MAKKSSAMRRDPYRLNEPSPRIAGGARRRSTMVRDRAFAPIRERARLEQLLLQHDPDGKPPSIASRDLGLLRQMAIEGALTNQVPAIRRGAILLLAATPTPENLELLVELAMSGEDLYARSHALLALGSTGLKIAAPLLRDALRSPERQERQAAESGLRLLGARVGPEIFAALVENERDAAVRQALGRVVAALAGERKPPRRRRISAHEPSSRNAT